MIIEDFAIPSALVLSLVLLKIRYKVSHYIGISICLVGISIGFLNDFLHLSDEKQTASRPILGDFLALIGAFCYALENVIMEYLIKKPGDVFNILGFIGAFGVMTTVVEAAVVGEFGAFAHINPGVSNWSIFANYAGMAATNFVCYTLIPFYIARSGATLLNLNNVTTILWSMLSDIFLFGGQFYPLYLAAFFVELGGILLFSLAKPEMRVEQRK